MDPFYFYVSVGALVLFIAILIIIGVMLTQLKGAVPFPPIQSACPDHWDVSSNPNYCGIEKNVIGTRNAGRLTGDSTGIYSGSANNIGFCNGSSFGCGSTAPLGAPTSSGAFHYLNLGKDNAGWKTLYPDKTTLCAQNRWANTMGISWDGVSNYNAC